MAVAVLLVGAGPALAASSPWVEADGGRMRIVTREAAADGILEGALQIELKPGWKTYWRDPGEAGVPPNISVKASDGISAVAIDYPAPVWISDGYSTYAAYDRPVALPLRFTVDPAASASAWRLNAQVFAGICQKVCIPVQSDVSIGPGDGENADAIIDAAFAALPIDAQPGFRAARAEDSGISLTVHVDLPATAKQAALFLAGSDGWYFGAPSRNSDGSFSVPVFDRPKKAPSQEPVQWHYTLTAGPMAVSGRIGLEKQ